LVTDSRGLPLQVVISPGQRHESKYLQKVLSHTKINCGVGRPRCRPEMIACDKGYDFNPVRKYLSQRGIKAVIPSRKSPYKKKAGRPRKLNRQDYRKRSIIEMSIGWLKHSRRIAMRFEKLARNYLGMVKLAILEKYMKEYLRDRT
jgi:transposase